MRIVLCALWMAAIVLPQALVDTARANDDAVGVRMLAVPVPARGGVMAASLGLVMRRVVDPETVRTVCLYRPNGRHLSPAAEGFAEHLMRWLPQWAAPADA